MMEKNTFATYENETRTLSQEQSVMAIRSRNSSGHFWRTVSLIIRREYKNQISQRSFVIGTIIMLVLLVLGACVPTAIEYFASSGANAVAEPESRAVGAQVAGYVIAYMGIILISLSVFLYGNTVVQGVAEEKGGRIMEILINATTPFRLMVGKILGIGAAALTQIALFVAVTIGAILLQTPLHALLFWECKWRPVS